MSRRDGTTTKVFVGSLPPEAKPEDLRKLFNSYGKIVECDIANRCGFLHLEDKELAEKAIKDLNNTMFLGSRISVERGRVKPPKSRRREHDNERGGRDRSGPYSRDADYGRGPRNGMGGGYARGYEFERYGYERGDAPRIYGAEYDGYPDRRSLYDDRSRDYMDGRRGDYPANGYGRPYDDRMAYADTRGGGYDDRRMAPYADAMDDRRPPGTDSRPLPDSASSRALSAYDRGSASNDMYSRRGDPAPSKSMSGYGDRNPTYADRNASYGDRGASSYGDRGASYGDRGASSYGDRGASSYADRGASTYADRGASSYADRGASLYGDRGATTYGDRNPSYGDYGSSAVGGDAYGSSGAYGGTSSAGYGGSSTTGAYATGSSGYGTGYDGTAGGGMQNVGQSSGGAAYGSASGAYNNESGAYSSGGGYGSASGGGGYGSASGGGGYGAGASAYGGGTGGYSSGGGAYGSSTGVASGGYDSAPATGSYGTGGGQGGYGDSYGGNRGTYDPYSAQTRSLSSGGGVRDRERDPRRGISTGPERRY